MNAVAASIIGVLGTGFLGLLYMQFQGLHKAMEKGFATIGSRFDRLEDRFDRLETRVGSLETKFESLLAKVGSLEGRFDRLENRFDRLENRFDRFDIKFTGHLSVHGERLARIEVELNIDPPPAEAA